MMRIARHSLGIPAFILLFGSISDGAEKIDFDRQIRPILSDYCFNCHGPDPKTRKGKLRLDTKEGLYKKGDDYSIVTPGKPESSELIYRMTTKDHEDRMPPPKSARHPTPAQIMLLKEWIKQGAGWQRHWAFDKPAKPALPKVKLNGWARNAIDRFILARLEAEGLQPSPEASREKLIRRVTMDLTGVPPTPKQIDNFLADQSKNAYEKVVDRLLASPAYGQRMAWEWLDAARYADTNGYQGDNERTMWPWRDWVVDAYNKNLRFDRFTTWQIAGDLLPKPTEEQILATGFNRNHMINGEGGRIPEENRVEYVFDQIETVGTIWLGLTFNCSRCHDHKFDPISQEDYYSLFAFYNQTPVNGGGGNSRTPPVISVATGPQKTLIDNLQKNLAQLRKDMHEHAKTIGARQKQWEQTMLSGTGTTGWHTLKTTRATAVSQQLKVLPDRSILAAGPNPANDTYTVTAKTDLKRITGIRLEALRHKSLTKNSLSKAASGNFVLTGFEVRLQDRAGQKPRLIKIKTAKATFEQGPLKIRNAHDGNPKTGWAVYENRVVDREHEAVFQFNQPVKISPSTLITITLRHDSRHKNHNLGRFRLSMTSDDSPQLSKSRGDIRTALNTKPDRRTDAQKRLLSQAFLKSDQTYQKLRSRENQINKQISEARRRLPQVMVMKDMSKKRKTFILEKGLYNQRRREVKAAIPKTLSPKVTITSPSRLALARWLVDPANPLTARVTINRYWQMLFGTGLVKSTENFGAQGEKPSHPKLLDYLATEFVRSGWNIKATLKMMVMSATYRQKAITTPELLEKDPSNRLLARGPRFRMPSWMIRDQALAASGLLVDKFGGPSVKPYQPKGIWAEATFGKKRYSQDHGEKLYRRSIYTFWRRIVGPTMLFDTSKRQVCSVKIARTNTPLHALTTLNDITYVEAARALAQRVLQAHELNSNQRINLAFRLVTSRRPTTAETQILSNRLALLKKRYATHNDEAARLLKVGESPRDEKIDPIQHAAYMGVCMIILNLDEALSK